MSVYWSVVSLSRGFPRRSRPILKTRVENNYTLTREQNTEASTHLRFFTPIRRSADAAGCSLEFIYMQMRQICKARLMIGEDEFGGRRAGGFLNVPTPSFCLLLPKCTGYGRTHSGSYFPLTAADTAASHSLARYNLALRQSKHNVSEFPM